MIKPFTFEQRRFRDLLVDSDVAGNRLAIACIQSLCLYELVKSANIQI